MTATSAPPFRAYLAIVAGWFFGFGLQTTLFPGVVYFTLAETPERLGLAQMALTLPMLLLLPAAGVLAERRDRRILLILFYGLASLFAAILAGLLMFGLLTYSALLVYALAVGTCGAFVMPARDSVINPIVRLSNRMGTPVSLQKAVIITSLVQFGAQIAGMAAGYVAQLIGPGPLFAVQAGGFALGLMAAILMPRMLSRRADKPHALQDLVDGIGAVIQSNVLGPMTAIMVAVGFFVVGGGFFVIIPVLVKDVYHASYGALSSLLVVFWLGAFIANAALARFGHIDRPGRVIVAAQLVTVVSLALLSFDMPFAGLYLLDLFWGLGAGVAISLSRAVVQEHAAKDKLARVLSVYQLGLFGGMPLGAVLMGYVVAHVGPRDAAWIPVIGLSVVLVAISLLTPILRIERRDPGQAIEARRNSQGDET
ncbi:MFS transporter [Hyphobacterium marinum]|uniref:MFS transporter n=1 Tax=Hyphobacterium marinum TaxID=3116574 RepID=A0ABU7M0M3_9PROT|nr:MFS transporter [Hyphobacterium sp. Y6023]MEE2567367.1 MFS transporter [Hyphobacterium sp. Y6023]